MSLRNNERIMGCAECCAQCCAEVVVEIAKYKCKNCGKIFEINLCRYNDGHLCFNRELGLCENCLNTLDFIDYCKRKKYGVRFKNNDENYRELEQRLAFNEKEVIFNKNLKGKIL